MPLSINTEKKTGVEAYMDKAVLPSSTTKIFHKYNRLTVKGHRFPSYGKIITFNSLKCVAEVTRSPPKSAGFFSFHNNKIVVGQMIRLYFPAAPPSIHVPVERPKSCSHIYMN